jgi:hypothetical protein
MVQSDVAPAKGNPLIDKGCILPNINDEFTGAGPDIGPSESGKPLPHYGPRKARQAQEESK